MKYDFDVMVIGLGPAGMAVSVMASEMGLKVLAIEKNKIGGECMNVGCIPSKALLEIAKTRHVFTRLEKFELSILSLPDIKKPFEKIQKSLDFISQAKTAKMFEKLELLLGKGEATFIDNHILEVAGKKYSAKKIFIATGTRPFIPPIKGIRDIEFLTNENIFKIDNIPKSLVILGGGAIGSEMAQAFSRLGAKVSIVHMDKHLIPVGDKKAGELIQEVFEKEGIDVFNGRSIVEIKKNDNKISLVTTDGEEIRGEKILVAAGRSISIDNLNLDKAKVKYTKRGIIVDKFLQTTQKNIYAVGDCNGHYLLSHSAMHQGMIALMNTLMPGPFKRNFKKYVIPWTVFTDPQVSHVGLTEDKLKKIKKKYEVVEAKYEDYGAAIAEECGIGFVKAYIGPLGQIYGASIVGEGSGEMINEWALAIQKKIKIYDIMMLQHSFPTMSFLTKRVSEMWMMNKMKSPILKRVIKLLFQSNL